MIKDRDAMIEKAKALIHSPATAPHIEDIAANVMASFALDQTAKAVAAERERIVRELEAMYETLDYDHLGTRNEALNAAIEIVNGGE